MNGVKKYKFLKDGINLIELQERLSLLEGNHLSQSDVLLLLDEVSIEPYQILEENRELDNYLALRGSNKTYNYSAPYNYKISVEDLMKLELYNKYAVDGSKVNNEAPSLSKRERPKAIEIIEALKTLNNEYPDTNKSDLLGQMKELILKFYGCEPELKELTRDIELSGASIDRSTISNNLKKAFQR